METWLGKPRDVGRVIVHGSGREAAALLVACSMRPALSRGGLLWLTGDTHLVSHTHQCILTEDSRPACLLERVRRGGAGRGPLLLVRPVRDGCSHRSLHLFVVEQLYRMIKWRGEIRVCRRGGGGPGATTRSTTSSPCRHGGWHNGRLLLWSWWPLMVPWGRFSPLLHPCRLVAPDDVRFGGYDHGQ